jgi:exonuclease SbcD
VHRHQNLNKSNKPPVIYPGSIERVDFSEEKEDKGYVMVEVESGSAKWEFCPLPARPFRTIEVDVSKTEDPLCAIAKSIAKNDIEDAVVRLVYKLRSEQLDLIDNSSLQEILTRAHTYTIHPELVSQLARPRVPELSASSSIDPMEALKTYLNNREDLQDIAKSMLEAAHTLLSSESEELLELSEKKNSASNSEALVSENTQLRLL